MELDSEMIILEVKKHPSLYDVDDKFYKSRDAKREGWIAVTKAVVGSLHFESMTEMEKNEVGKEIQRRWKNLKDSYHKTLKMGLDGTRKRPYIYHRKMAFVQPMLALKQRKHENPYEGDGMRASPEPHEPIVEPTGGPRSESPHLRLHSSQPQVQPNSKKAKPQKTITGGNKFEKKLWELFKTNLESTSSQSQDHDEQFVRSQVQLIKKLGPSDKLDFQIKWMELIKSYDIEKSDSES